MALEQLLSSYSDEVINSAQMVRNYLLTNFPILVEEVDLPSRLLAYRIAPGLKGIVFTILFSKREVKLGLYQGSQLDDPTHLMQGKGKVHKYIRMNSKTLEDPGFHAITQAAVRAALDRTNQGGSFVSKIDP